MTSSPEFGSLELYTRTMLEILGDTERLTLLDLCCGELSHVSQMKWKESLHVDALDWPSRPKDAAFVCGDAIDVSLKLLGDGKRFDVALCSDGLEHFPIQSGFRLLSVLERIADVAIIFTPIGQLGSMIPDSQDPHQHKSAWTPDDFKCLGWNVAAFQNFHPGWEIGAFFAWTRKNQR